MWSNSNSRLRTTFHQVGLSFIESVPRPSIPTNPNTTDPTHTRSTPDKRTEIPYDYFDSNTPDVSSDVRAMSFVGDFQNVISVRSVINDLISLSVDLKKHLIYPYVCDRICRTMWMPISSKRQQPLQDWIGASITRDSPLQPRSDLTTTSLLGLPYRSSHQNQFYGCPRSQELRCHVLLPPSVRNWPLGVLWSLRIVPTWRTSMTNKRDAKTILPVFSRRKWTWRSGRYSIEEQSDTSGTHENLMDSIKSSQKINWWPNV